MNLNIPNGLRVRPAKPSDKPFLESVYDSTRDDLRSADASDDYIQTLIDLQFKAQTEGYGDAFPNAVYFVIELHQQNIGKATLDFGHNDICLVDLAFIPEARGKGYGKVVIQSFQQAATQSSMPITLSVLQTNIQAKSLYLSLGFTVTNVKPPYEEMAWYPQASKIIT